MQICRSTALGLAILMTPASPFVQIWTAQSQIYLNAVNPSRNHHDLVLHTVVVSALQGKLDETYTEEFLDMIATLERELAQTSDPEAASTQLWNLGGVS